MQLQSVSILSPPLLVWLHLCCSSVPSGLLLSSSSLFWHINQSEQNMSLTELWLLIGSGPRWCIRSAAAFWNPSLRQSTRLTNSKNNKEIGWNKSTKFRLLPRGRHDHFIQKGKVILSKQMSELDINACNYIHIYIHAHLRWSGHLFTW